MCFCFILDPNGSQEKSWVARWSNCGMKTYAMFNTEDRRIASSTDGGYDGYEWLWSKKGSELANLPKPQRGLAN